MPSLPFLLSCEDDLSSCPGPDEEGEKKKKKKRKNETSSEETSDELWLFFFAKFPSLRSPFP